MGGESFHKAKSLQEFKDSLNRKYKTETEVYVEYLHQQISNLRMQYEKGIEPYVKELVKIESMRMKPMSVSMSKEEFDRMFPEEGTGLAIKPQEGWNGN